VPFERGRSVVGSSLAVVLVKQEVAACGAWRGRAPGSWSFRNAGRGAPISAANAPRHTYSLQAIELFRYPELFRAQQMGTQQSGFHAVHLPRRLATPFTLHPPILSLHAFNYWEEHTEAPRPQQQAGQATTCLRCHSTQFVRASNACCGRAAPAARLRRRRLRGPGGQPCSVQAAQQHVAVLDLQVAHAQQHRRVAAAVARDAQPRVHVHHVEPAAPERRSHRLRAPSFSIASAKRKASRCGPLVRRLPMTVNAPKSCCRASWPSFASAAAVHAGGSGALSARVDALRKVQTRRVLRAAAPSWPARPGRPTSCAPRRGAASGRAGTHERAAAPPGRGTGRGSTGTRTPGGKYDRVVDGSGLLPP